MNPPSGWSTIGDASSVVLTNGTLMLANCCTTQQALLNASTLTWTSTGSGKFDENDEEGWNLLPGGKVLTVDAYVNLNDPNGTNSELYNPGTGSWSSAGSTIVQLWDSHGSYEVGPAMLRPDGTGSLPPEPMVLARVTLLSTTRTQEHGRRGRIFPVTLTLPTDRQLCCPTVMSGR